MAEYKVKIKSIENVTHDTLRIVTEKPGGYSFKPGQATEIAINKNGWQNEKRPFTFTSLPGDADLEFIIKTYPEHNGATDKLLDVEVGDELILDEVFGTIDYRGEGLFIAGGAGITPFVAIFRDLQKKEALGMNRLVFANKTSRDIILKEELDEILGNRVVHVLSEEKAQDHAHGLVDKEFLKEHISGGENFFYLCGPPPMMDAVEKHLYDLGVSKKSIIKEGW